MGCLLNDGPDCVGEPVLVDIGIDENCIENNKYFVQKQNLRCPVKRKKNSHKYDYGSVVIIAGSKGMIGAGLLATEGALKMCIRDRRWCVPGRSGIRAGP